MQGAEWKDPEKEKGVRARTIDGELRTVEGFALVECGSHIAPLRLGGSRFAVNAFVPANR